MEGKGKLQLIVLALLWTVKAQSELRQYPVSSFDGKCFDCLLTTGVENTGSLPQFYCPSAQTCHASDEITAGMTCSSSTYNNAFINNLELCRDAVVTTKCALTGADDTPTENRIIVESDGGIYVKHQGDPIVPGQVYTKNFRVEPDNVCIILLANTQITDYSGEGATAKYKIIDYQVIPRPGSTAAELNREQILFRKSIPEDSFGTRAANRDELELLEIDKDYEVIPRNYTYIYVANNDQYSVQFMIEYSQAHWELVARTALASLFSAFMLI